MLPAGRGDTRRSARQGRYTPELALDAVRTMKELALPTFASVNLLELADERLANAVGASLPVKWLGAM